MKKNKFNAKTICFLAVLIAMEVVLNRFLSINAWNIKIGFSFVPVVIAGIYMGPLYSAMVAGIGDFLGAILFPIGPYFPGFTLTASLTGLVFGILLFKKVSISRIILSVTINQLILALLLNTFWISFLYNTPFLPTMYTRIIQVMILIPVQFVVIKAIYGLSDRLIKEQIFE